ncbi:MAG: DUF1553 domain-containing protein [Planctomycetota bacterium]|nr:DUF1553 domain-containing protein [Planctomycetota bacterium]
MNWFSAFLRLAVMIPAAAFPLAVALAETHPEPLEYNRDIRPILSDKCFSCHGADSASREAGLRLDERDNAIEMGAIAAGDLEGSEMVARIETDDPDIIMPPPETKKALSTTEKELLKRWINEGAEYQPHWSFIAPQKAALPAVEKEDWVKNPIDRFILARLESEGLAPAPEADPLTLFRRLHLDITGLPPDPAESRLFAEEYTQDAEAAMENWIDRLMQRPTWGEHRARYWLDAARYGDTHGLHFDNYREMWPYRDWVIRAFNSNQPFDQFTIEQIAGDMLPDPTEDQLIATGLQRCNITTNEGGTIDEENLAIYAADRVQTLGWVYLGLTTNCCQCHDHKFDPITMKDYYAMAAFFRNTTQRAKDGNAKDGLGPVLVLPSDEDRPRWESLPPEITAAEKLRNTRRDAAEPTFETWLTTATPDSFEAGIVADKNIIRLPLTEAEGDTIHGTIGSAGTANGQAESTSYTAASSPEWIEGGKFGKAPHLSDAANFELGDLARFEKDQAFSFGGWIKPVSKKNTGTILGRIDQSNQDRGWDLWQNGNAYAVHLVSAWPEKAIKTRVYQNRLQENQWQHVFVTYDGSGKAAGVKIFLNGNQQPLLVEKDALPEDASILSDTPLRLGRRSEKNAFTGAVQDIRIYDRALYPREVRALANLPVIHQALARAQEPAVDETDQNSAVADADSADNADNAESDEAAKEAAKAAQQAKQKARDQVFDHYLVTLDPNYPELSRAVTDLQREQAAIRDRSPMTHIQREKKDSPAMAHILMRGEYDKKGDLVSADTPAALHPMKEDAPKNRLGLAEWLVDPANPLTARVTVNRFWQEVFGRGIVPTPEDFGITGTLPSHDALLDWLAIDFQQNGWDVKNFFKQMLMSNTYRQAAITSEAKTEKDRDNALLSRGPRFRMDAEMIRDYALASCGLLSEKMYGPSVRPYQPINIWDVVGLPGGNTRDYKQDTGESLHRRTLYSFWKRMAPPPNMDAFNAPSREVCTVKRERTNTPLQALVTLNDPQFVETSRKLAEAALRNSSDENSTALYIADRTLCRPLAEDERAIILAAFRDFVSHYRNAPEAATQLVGVGETEPAEGLDPATVAAWTMVASEMFNLDEVLNK